MTDPITTLDPRFSDPEAVPTSWEETRRALESAQLSWLTTVRRDGRPHVTPLVAVWLDDALYFTTGPEEQKAVNIEHNRHVAVTTGCNEWERGMDVVVEGEAARVSDHSLLEVLVDAWAEKWDGRWDYKVGGNGFTQANGGPTLVFRVEPSKVFAFGKGRFSQTRHRF